MKKLLSDRIFSVITYTVLTVIIIVTLYPLVLALSVSLSDNLSVQKFGYSLIPQKFSLTAYSYIIKGNWILSSYAVTILVTVAGTALSFAVTTCLAYAISVKGVKYRNVIAFYCFFTMIFSAGLAPWYIVLTKYYHLSNTVWAMIIPYLVNPWYMFLMRNYFQSLPEALSEAAKIDGANDFKIFARIILPVSTPIVATVVLFISLTYWNDWWLNLLFITDSRLYMLQYELFQILSNILFLSSSSSVSSGVSANVSVPSETIKMATTIVTIGPIILLYPLLQKYLIKGIMVGAIKG